MNEQLFSLFLKYDGQFRSLTKITLAQLTLKIMLAKGEAVGVKYVIGRLQQLTKADLNDQYVNEILETLRKDGKLIKEGFKYKLKDSYRKKLNKDLKLQEEKQNQIIEFWFGKAESDIEIIKSWFIKTMILFFTNFSQDWVREICEQGKRSLSGTPNIREVLQESFAQNTTILEADKEWLVKQFLKFLESDRPEDQWILWVYGTSSFSSAIMNTGLHADKVSVEMFRDSTFVLDTNILMVLQTEDQKLRDSFAGIERVMTKFRISPKYFHISKEEYCRALDHVRTQLKSAFTKYDLDVLKASTDPYLVTAIKLGCENEEDIDRFLDQFIDIPKKLHDTVAVDMLDDDGALLVEIDKGANDAGIHKKLDNIQIDRFGFPKRDNAKRHDAGLITGVSYLRKNEGKHWILTKDGTVQRYALENVVRDEEPIALSLGAFVNMMAVNSGSADIDPENFAPLFSRIVKRSLHPEDGAFTLADLSMMEERRIEINNLPKDEVVDILNELHKMRFSGASVEDIDLFLRRRLQGKKMAMEKDIDEARKKADKEKADRERAEKLNSDLIEDYRKNRTEELRKGYDRKVWKDRLVFFSIPFTIIVLTIFAVLFSDSDNKLGIFIGAITIELLGAVLTTKFWFSPRLARRYSEYHSKIDDQVQREIDAKIALSVTNSTN